MSEAWTPPAKTRGQKKAERRLDAWLEERQALQAQRTEETFRYNETIELAKRQRDDALLGTDRRVKEIDAEIAAYVKGRLFWIRRWFSKTIRRPDGIIKIVNRAAELEMPEDAGLVTDQLDKIPGGEAYIRTVREPDRGALRQAPDEIIKALEPVGVRRVPHDTILVQSLSDATAKQIAKWRASERTRRTTPKK